MLQILSTSNETSTGPELVQNGDFAEIGSELITNGDFSATPLGSELVVNPNFVTDDISAWNIAGTPSRATKSWNASQFMRLTYDVAAGQALYDNLGHTLNAYYNVKMRVRGTKADGSTAQGSLFHSIGDLANIGVVISNPTLTSEWQDYEFNVWSTEVTFRFYLASAEIGDLVDFDSISVKENTNLVTNPNFTDTGSDVIVDGDFPPASTAWTLVNATLESGGARIDNGATTDNAYILQGILGSPSGKSFVLTYDIIATNGELLAIEQLSEVVLDTATTGTNRKVYFTWDRADDNLIIKRKCCESVDITIDNVSIKELGEDWVSVDDTNTFGENGLTMTSTEGLDVKIYQDNVISNSKSYKVTYTIHENGLTGTNAIQYYTGSGFAGYADLPDQSVGTHTFYYTAPSVANDRWFFRLDLRGGSTSTTDFVTISSLVVQELGEGWNLSAVGGISFNGGGLSLDSSEIDTSGGGTVYSSCTQVGTIIEIGKSYKLVIDNLNITSGNVELKFGLDHTTTPARPVLTSADNGTYTDYFKAQTVNDGFTINSAAGTVATLSSISVQQLDPNGYWSLGTGWSIGDLKALYDGSAVGYSWIDQTIGSVLNRSYKVTFDAVVTSGLFQFKMGSVNADATRENITISSTDSYSIDLVSGGSSGSGIYGVANAGNFVGSITNVSVKLLGTYSDQSIYVTAADVQTIPQASVYYLVELTSMASKNSIYFLPSSVVPNNGRYTKLNFTVVSKDALPTPASGIISFYDSVGGFDTYPMGFYEFRIYEQTSSTNLDPLLATGLLEKGFAFVRDFSGNMQELTDGFKEYNPTLTQYVYSK